MKTIEQLWDGFSATVVPVDAGEGQVRDMRDAFFGGAWAIYNEFIGSPDDEDAFLEFAAKLDVEFEIWISTVRQRTGEPFPGAH